MTEATVPFNFSMPDDVATTPRTRYEQGRYEVHPPVSLAKRYQEMQKQIATKGKGSPQKRS